MNDCCATAVVLAEGPEAELDSVRSGGCGTIGCAVPGTVNEGATPRPMPVSRRIVLQCARDEVNEASDLCRQVLAMRIGREDSKLSGVVFG